MMCRKTATRPKIVGTGLIALDWVIRPDTGSRIGAWVGGTCGNVLSILAYLDWEVYPIARLNGDCASRHIRSDMERWGVHLDWIDCHPTTDTPIIVHELRRRTDGQPQHRFSWACPYCGESLPTFRPITLEVVDSVRRSLADASVFFLDRLSRATLTLASEASARGALVVFEPSARGNKNYMAEAIDVAHVVKYAHDRLPEGADVMEHSAVTLLEIQTLGARGLIYRHRLGGGISSWTHLEAVPAPYLADTCGCGDWCTAGLISKVGHRGVEGLLRGGVRGIRGGLRYGQALAAWNCGFEGARGGMYAVPGETFGRQILELLDGVAYSTPNRCIEETSMQDFACPSCSSTPTGSQGRDHF